MEKDEQEQKRDDEITKLFSKLRDARGSKTEMNYQQDEAMFLSLLWNFYRCPTTGRIIQSLPHDDKVICGCGRSNPKVLQERTEETGTHIVRFLTTATAEEYLREKGIKNL